MREKEKTMKYSKAVQGGYMFLPLIHDMLVGSASTQCIIFDIKPSKAILIGPHALI